VSQRLYTDGGVVKVNPSPIGGTWAWVLTQDDGEGEGIVRCASGLILPAECDGASVSNNVAELRAALEALEAMPGYWRGTLLSDSQITLGRIFKGWPLKGVPLDLYRRLHRIQLRLREDLQVEPVLLQGHPTKADLARGIGAKRGYPVSKFNKWCDEACQEQARRALASLEVPV
jgi:ribonuclease HI